MTCYPFSTTVSSPLLASVLRAVWAALLWLPSRVAPAPWDTCGQDEDNGSDGGDGDGDGGDGGDGDGDGDDYRYRSDLSKKAF